MLPAWSPWWGSGWSVSQIPIAHCCRPFSPTLEWERAEGLGMCPNIPGPGTEQGEMDVHSQTKEQEIFPTWLILLLSFCAQKHTRAGTRLIRRGREVWQRWMFHQVSRDICSFSYPNKLGLQAVAFGAFPWNQRLLEWDVSFSAYTKL